MLSINLRESVYAVGALSEPSCSKIKSGEKKIKAFLTTNILRKWKNEQDTKILLHTSCFENGVFAKRSWKEVFEF